MGGRPVVVVTGASGGVGRATARRFAEQGAVVALLARGEKGLAGAAREVAAAGGNPLALQVDMAGYVYGTQAALERMLARDRGTIVQVGSALAYRGIPLQSAYCAAKHAIQGFHDSLRAELLHDGSNVHVTMVQLPAVNTPQFDWVLSRLPRRPQPVPPIYQPELAARSIVHAAAHPRRREYWVGGAVAATVIANKIMPGLLDRYLARTAYRSQQTGEPALPDAPANLWEPADGPAGRDFGAHGRFDGQSKTRSYQLWASQHHRLLGATAGLGVLVGLIRLRRARSGNRP